MHPSAEKAVAMFESGFNCAQSVLACCGEPRGLSRETAMRLGGPLAGGIGCSGQTCGAVLAACMVVGLEHAKTRAGEEQARQRGHELAGEVLRRFAAEHGSTLCRDLLGCDLSRPGAQAEAQQKGLFKTVCPRMVRDAAQLVEQVLAQPHADGK